MVFLVIDDESLFFSWISYIWILIPLLITLYVHFTYLYKNIGDKYIIKPSFILDKRKKLKYNNTEISKIIIHKSGFLRLGRYAYFPFQHYKYCEVLLKNGNKIILTSLLFHNIDEYLKENLKGVLFENDDSSFSYFL
jgi:hypothetical protein